MGRGPRTHELLEAALIKEGIKYRIVGSYSILERAAAKDLLAYPRLLLNPEDDASFRRIFNVPNRGLGECLRIFYKRRDRSPFGGYSRCSSSRYFCFCTEIGTKVGCLEPPHLLLCKICGHLLNDFWIYHLVGCCQPRLCKADIFTSCMLIGLDYIAGE